MTDHPAQLPTAPAAAPSTDLAPAELRPYDPARDRDVLLRLLSVTASLAGLCIAALGFMEIGAPDAGDRSFADEVIALDGLLFVFCVYLILWALRTTRVSRVRTLTRIIDVIFLFALTTLLVAAGYILFRVL